MEALEMGGNTREIIKDKLRANFDGKIVRKDLTKKIKCPCICPGISAWSVL